MSFEYPQGLRFKCLKCGICCGDTTEKNRHILLLKSEAEQIAASIGKPTAEFTVKVEGTEPYVYEIRKTAKDGKCVFLKSNQCTVYSLRPLICRFYPFELKAVVNRNHEFHPTDECPGLGKGRLMREEHFGKLFKLAQKGARVERRLN